jgi:hypothetical protein
MLTLPNSQGPCRESSTHDALRPESSRSSTALSSSDPEILSGTLDAYFSLSVREIDTHSRMASSIEIPGRWTLACAENLPMRIKLIDLQVHAHSVEKVSFNPYCTPQPVPQISFSRPVTPCGSELRGHSESSSEPILGVDEI